MRLNVCCGKMLLDGYVNIDLEPTEGVSPDVMCDAKSLPYENGTVDEILCIHGFEHFYRWEVDALVAEWRRLLRAGGDLVLELPDLIKCCENIVRGYEGGRDPDQLTLWGLYGDPRLKNPHMIHRWAWSSKSLRAYLREQGFVDVREAETLFHPIGRARRDMRIMARKPV